ncbi:MAG: GNAT family N-acetyltransferase [Lachnospiraceae bacterium]|nr:GNAT family N-acetyltransferase [Lachnospiraceae bacterium]
MLSRKEKEFFQPDPGKIDILEKARQELNDPEKFIEAYNDDVKKAAGLREELRQLLKIPIKGYSSLEKVEKLFMQRQKVLYRIAKRVHPLSPFGKNVLRTAVADRKAYEKIAGKIIAAVTGEDSEYFAAVFSEDMLEAVEAGKYRAIGIIQSNRAGRYGVGALAYYYDAGVGGETILRIPWLYVHPDHRRHGCADVLIAEVLNAAIEKRVSAVTLDFHPGDHFDSFGCLLDNWHFTFTPAIETDFVCRIGDINTGGRIEKLAGEVVFLSEIAEEKAHVLIKRFLALSEYNGYIASESLPHDYIDMELSCFTGSDTRPSGLLLAHKRPSGDIGVEFIRCLPESEDDTEYLFCNFAMKAAVQSAEDDLMFISVDSDEDAFVLDEYFPIQQGNLIVGAILQTPEESFNV